MTLADYVTIPSSLPAPFSGQALPDFRSRRDRRLREAGLTVVTCDTCGEHATVEECTVHRPGTTPLRRTITRCQGRAIGDGHHAYRCRPIVEDRPIPVPRTCAQPGCDARLPTVTRQRFCSWCSTLKKRARAIAYTWRRKRERRTPA